MHRKFNEINQSNLGFKVKQERGVLIVLLPNSQQRGEGTRPGDIITEVKGVQIQT